MSDSQDGLYHYTNLGGLTGILRSKTLWATDIRYLNDANELSYGVAEMAQVLERLGNEMPELTGEDREKYGSSSEQAKEFDHNDPQFPGSAKKAVYAAASSLAALVNPDVPQMPSQWKWSNGYVTCLTTEGDSLGQWRGYAGGGGGFALGFRAESLAELSISVWDYEKGEIGTESEDGWVPYPVSPPQPVVYGPGGRSELLALGEQMLRGFFEKAGAVVPYTSFSIDTFTIGFRLCSTMKDDAFEEEREWRLVAAQPHSAKLSFRSGGFGNGGIVPYTKIAYPKEALTRIVIGPGNASDLRERAVRQMLEINGFGFDDVEVVHSQVPFRE